MSKIAEQKALEAYPQKIGYTDMGDVDWNLPQRNAYLLGYDQAIQVMDNLQKDAKCQEETEEVTLAKLNATIQYNQGLKDGYNQDFQDFLDKAEKFFINELYVSISDQICSRNNFASVSNFIEQFKNYMQNAEI